MANFCQHCGAPLEAGTKFCPGCGKPVAQTPVARPVQAPPPPAVQPPRPPVAPRPQPPVYPPQPPMPKKKGKGGLIALLVILAVAVVIGVVCFFGFRDGGFFRGNNTPAYDVTAMESLLDYAKRLEEAGNEEAAAAIYEQIAQGGGAELIEKAHEDVPLIEAADEINEVTDLFSRKGDNAK